MRAYTALLRLPGAAAFSGAALVGRMPISMLGIGSVLLVQDRRGSYALAGAVAAAYALGLAVLGPLVSRLVDRRGQRPVLTSGLLVSSAGLLTVVLAAGTSAPAGVLLAAATVAGAALPPLGSCVRARWSTLLRRLGRAGELETALALESVLDEVVFVAGPALVVALAVTVDPAAGLLLGLALQGAGTLAFVAQTTTAPDVLVGEPGSLLGALRYPGLRTCLAGQLFVGVLFGGLEVVMVAFAVDQGRPGAAGVLLPLFAVSSGVAGLAYGTRTWRSPVPTRYLLALLGLAVGMVPVVLAPSVALMVPAALLAGLAVSPTLIAAFGLVEALVPPAARTEGFAWLNSGLGAGVAAGSAVGGSLAQAHGSRAGFLTCLVGGVLALAVTAAGRRTLQVDVGHPAAPRH